MQFRFMVTKVVHNLDVLRDEYRVLLKADDGHRLVLIFDREEYVHGFTPGVTVVSVEVKNPQRTLEASSEVKPE